MTISKLLPVLCALALGALCFTVRAEDNPAQAAARMALAKQQFGEPATNAPAAATNAATPANDKQARAEAKARAKAEANAKARQEAEAKQEAALKAQAEKNAAAQQAAQAKAAAEQASAKARADKAAADAQAQQVKRAQTSAVAAQPATEPAPAAGDNPAQAAARAALLNQLPAANNTWATAPESTPAARQAATTSTSNPVPAPPPVVFQPGTPTDNNYVGRELGLKQIPPPTLPISSSKEARLQALLEKYRANQITPDAYHQQRAAILAEP